MCQEEELAASCGRGLKPGERFDQEYDQILSSIINLRYHHYKTLSPQDYSGRQERLVMIVH